MQIIIKTTNIDLSPSIKEYIEKRIGGLTKFLKRIDQEIVKIEVEVGKPSRHHRKGNVYYAEANISLPGKLLRAESESWDIYLAIDEIKESLIRQIERYKYK